MTGLNNSESPWKSRALSERLRIHPSSGTPRRSAGWFRFGNADLASGEQNFALPLRNADGFALTGDDVFAFLDPLSFLRTARS
jgi:hypothetical protein